ncbi:2-iminobutanoate/2-iminopropanoate deaminase [Mycobacterium frederiksbergense]|uniref:2-iminobutanoate/2-iminopropanoate deaminase n=1 Tax=Mycolicibacterium frederiksbergense TaxID=117567 RepID=A0ABT6KTT2_9MYCO|nr:Rid family hydrolase [Mycolicibacterium frederiksbergense]MDH6194121.1 2-iminobutanoate/2-iminopropanoate deaminase [Mycolicibacterium frederiksbergense]
MTYFSSDVEPIRRQRIMPEGSWDWHIPTPFSQGWRVGQTVYVGGQLSADEHGNVVGAGDIEVQTRNVFEAVTRVLEEGGATWRDVVKLNTYYCCNETGDAVQEFWEKMTRVRLEYLPTPGPVGTAIRVAGLMYEGFLIEVDAIAVVGSGETSVGA